MTLLRAENLRLSAQGRVILDDVSFALDGGEVVGLIGPNGAGKSTLLRLLAGLLQPNHGAVELAGQSVLKIPPMQRARKLAFLPQNTSIGWSLSVKDVVMLGRLPFRRAFAAPTPHDHAIVRRALEETGLLSMEERSINRLSGGEQARVLFARALAGEPEILLADEPTANLDPAHQLDLMDRLRAMAKGGAGVIVVLHDLTLAARSCDRLILLHEGKIAAEGAPRDVLQAEPLAESYGIAAHHFSIGEDVFVVPYGHARAGGGM